VHSSSILFRNPHIATLVKMELKGSIVALVTPMQDNGDLDLEALDGLVEFHIQNGTRGIVSVGTTGESATLAVPEHFEVVARTVKRVDGRIPVIAGTGANSTSEAIELTRGASELGANACLLVTPYYNKPGQEGLYRHFQAVAESVDIPQILYNVPARTGCDLQNDTVERLSSIKNIIGIKDATGDLERGGDLVKRVGDKMLVFSGDDLTALGHMLQGGDGDISVTANVAPKLMSEMCDAALAGNSELATTLNERLMALHRDLFIEANPIPVKWAVHRMGLTGHHLRLPMTELELSHHHIVEQAMSAAGVI
jgi:4-hydroxy-tetrahydrodipicolinate synthase